MSRRLPLLFCLLLCTFGAAACGDDGGGDVDVDKVLQQTFGEDKDINSGRLDVNLRLDANGLAQLKGPVSARLAGPFVNPDSDELPRFDFEADLNAGGQSIRAGATSTGDKGFISFQGQAYQLSDELYQQFKTGYAQEAKKSSADKDGVSFKSLGIDPQSWLTDPKSEGTDDVGGAKTIHISTGIDVPKLLEDVNRILARAEKIQGDKARQLTEAERKQISDAIKDAKLDLWTGEKDKILRRLNVKLQFEVPEASRQQANGLTSGTISFDLGLGGINDEQTIRTPENAKPLEQLIGSLSGQGSGSAGSSDAPPGSSSEYDKCVEAAGADISKLQECAGLADGG
jgi:hypothetical protein